LAEPFIVHPSIEKQFPLTRIICLIDAELIEGQLEETEEAINQITFSDVLLINKIDLVSEDYLLKLKERLQLLNPLATIIFGQENNFPNLGLERHNTQFDEGVFGLVENPSPKEPQNFPLGIPHTHHHHHEHTNDVVSHLITFDRPFDYHVLNHRLLIYLTLQAKGLYRMKGLLWLKGNNKQHLLQSVGKRLVINEKRVWKTEEVKQSKIVFIGKNIQKKALEKMLFQCLAKN